MKIELTHLDHLVLTVSDIQATLTFYTLLGMTVKQFNQGRYALFFGSQKINLHWVKTPFEPKAHLPTPGSADLCLIVSQPIEAVKSHLISEGLEIIEGPIRRTGAQGPLNSIYLRDPDLNLVELANALA